MNKLSPGISGLLLLSLATPLAAQPTQAKQTPSPQTPSQKAPSQKTKQPAAAKANAPTLQQRWQQVSRQQGEIVLPGGIGKLKLPKQYFYLNPEDSKLVLEKIWGNPAGEERLGMIFPSVSSPFDADSWAVTIGYRSDGHISDKDADKINFEALLRAMQADTQAVNKQRLAQGFQSVQLVGWASVPYYNSDNKKLHWGERLRFAGDDADVLNYNIRILGREGYLLLTFIANIGQLQPPNNNMQNILAMAEFTEGNRYQDYQAGIDKLANYDIAALVAGKALTKGGLLAKALFFIKKFWFIGVLLVGGLAGLLIKRKVGQRRAK
ncbi:MAG: DUF2167 domain-containing protein [Cellvibrionaceae bacterium]|nr:DUF2167 domain-containing protein [Cellvibrionaceae bacterium]